MVLLFRRPFDFGMSTIVNKMRNLYQKIIDWGKAIAGSIEP
jgi:hypothetical protein